MGVLEELFATHRRAARAWCATTILLLSLGGAPRAIALGINPDRCREELAQAVLNDAQYKPLSLQGHLEQRKFIEDILLPITGLRLLSLDRTRSRPFHLEGNSFMFSEFYDTAFKDAEATAAKNVRITWVTDRTEPEIVHLENELLLLVPRGYDFSVLPDGGATWMRGLLMGHPLQPYIYSERAKNERDVLHEPRILLKSGQIEGIRAVEEAIDRGERRFLYVAPTGYGKTEVLKAMLAKQVTATQGAEKRKLHVVLAHDNGLVKQLFDDAKELQREGTARFVVKRWGGEEGSQSLEELMREVEASPLPVVLVSTTQSFRERVHEDVKDNEAKSAENREANIKKLREYLATLGFDEAHHAGAEQTKALVFDLIDSEDSTTLLYGTTATPTHREIQLIRDLWRERAFFAGLDSAHSYAAAGGATKLTLQEIGSGAGTASRTIEDVILQLSMATSKYEVTPVRGYLFLDPAKVQENGPDAELWIRDKKKKKPGDKGKEEEVGRYRINPLHYPNLLGSLRPMFESHTMTLLTVSSIAEAGDIAKAIEDMQKEKPGAKPLRVGVLHSQLDPNAIRNERMQEEVLLKAKQGKYDIIISVGMLDEGKNIPALDLYVDLNMNPQIKQILQRLGRELRIAPHKEGIDMALFVDVDADEGAERLTLVNAIATGQFSGGAGKREALPLKTGAKIYWNYPEVRQQFESKPFFDRKVADEKKGQDDAETLLKFIDRTRSRLFRLPAAWFEKSERLLEDMLSKYLDQTVENGGARRRSFFERLAREPRDTQDLIEAHAHRRQLDRQRMTTAVGAAEVLDAFVQRARMLPRTADTSKTSEKASVDEDRLRKAMTAWRSHAAFMATVQKYTLELLLIMQRDALTALFLSKFNDDAQVGKWLEEFVTTFNYLPRENGNAFERRLQQSVAAANTPEKRARFPEIVREAIERPAREAAERLRIQAEEKAREKAAAKAAKAVAAAPVADATVKKPTLPKNLPPKPTIAPALTVRIERKITADLESAERLKDYAAMARLSALSASLIQYQNSARSYAEGLQEADLAKITEASGRGHEAILDLILGLVPKPTLNANQVTMTLFPMKRDPRNLPRAEALADFYVRSIRAHQKTRGWSVVLEKAENHVLLKISGSGVRQFLATEQGEHNIQYRERGQTFTNPIGVNMLDEVQPLKSVGRVYRLSERGELTVANQEPDLDQIAREAMLALLDKQLPP